MSHRNVSASSKTASGANRWCSNALVITCLKSVAFAAVVTSAALVGAPARAVDGCLDLLCLAAPSWSSILQCVAPIQQLFDDLAHGRPFPSCSMSGAGNQGSHRWSNPPEFCPPQYTHADALESGTRYTCDYDGAVEIDIDGALWARTWWRMSGGTSTEFSAAAKSQLGTWDTRFDDDYAAWLGLQGPAG